MSALFVKTDTILDRILANTAQEVGKRKEQLPLADLIRLASQVGPPRDMLVALDRETVALIAEIKHASPSKGVLIEPFDPVALATIYEANGAAAISVLTDSAFFGGSLGDLSAVRQSVQLPVLRKDFVIDPYQVYEGRVAGADAVLLIVAALADGQLAELYSLIRALHMTPLVEVHNEHELERALRLNPPLLGVNNRNLKTFEVNLDTSVRLVELIPAETALVIESGIHSALDVQRAAAMGACAVLVGESLVRAPDIAAQVQALSGQMRRQVREQSVERAA
jgi:indole-3-glycerol phosphate synthase